MGGIEKPHAVCIPFPAQGHINPMLKLAKLLHSNGFHITFVNTEYNHRRLLEARGPASLDGIPSFRFETIPDGLPPSNAAQNLKHVCKSTTTCLPHFKKLIAKLNNDGVSGVPPVSCIVSDGIMSFTVDAAIELGLPSVLFWAISVGAFYAFSQFEKVVQMGYAPHKDKSYLSKIGYMDTIIEGIPAMEGIRLRDFPSFITHDDIVEFFTAEFKRAQRASANVFNTFEALDCDLLDAISTIFIPPTIAIGPLHLLEQDLVIDEFVDQIGTNLWREESECLDWLNEQAPNSVVYINFGSTTVITPEQLTEFAWGVGNSNHKFLWVMRPDLVSGEVAMLPPKFLEATRERGLMTGWCPQEKVLGHPAIGVFLTHCGWNLILESISNGVPMICWPFFGDHPTICWSCCKQWGIGMEINNNVKKDEVQNIIQTLMVGGKAEEMKKRAIVWKNLALKSSKISSYQNLRKLIDQVLLTSRKD